MARTKISHQLWLEYSEEIDRILNSLKCNLIYVSWCDFRKLAPIIVMDLWWQDNDVSQKDYQSWVSLR